MNADYYDCYDYADLSIDIYKLLCMELQYKKHLEAQLKLYKKKIIKNHKDHNNRRSL